MTVGVLLAVLGAALLHASWNAAIKLQGSKVGGMLAMTFGQGLIGCLVALTRPLPSVEAWGWILVSALVHTSYQIFLAWAYEKGDLSRVYPIARGSAPLMVLVVGSVLLPDRLAPAEVLGIIVLGAGILGMAAGVFRSGESIALLPFALATAAATATYSMVDGTGARVDGDAVAYVGWLLVMATFFYAPIAVWMRGTAVIPRGARSWLWGLGAGTASWAAYALVVWAMTRAPIALVAALRETSILFAVLLGWALFGDRMTGGKWVSAALILLGVLLTRFARLGA